MVRWLSARVSLLPAQPAPRARSWRNLVAGAVGRREGAFVVLFGLLLTATMAGCRPKTREGGAAELPVLPVSHPVERVVTDYVDFTGRTDAVQSVNIIAGSPVIWCRCPSRKGRKSRPATCCLRSIRVPTKRNLTRPRARSSLPSAARPGEEHFGSL